MIKAYKYKIKPTADQESLLNEFFGSARYIYNWGLDKEIENYRANSKRIGYNKLAGMLTVLKREEGYSWLQNTPNEVLQQSLRNLDKAYANFFKKTAKFPKFKSKRYSHVSIKFIKSVHFNFDTWEVQLPKLKKVRICKNETFDINTCKQGTCTVSRDNCGVYWCCINIDDRKDFPTKAKLDYHTSVGIDVGIKDFAVLSNGTKYANPKHLDRNLKHLAHLQRSFARKQKGSRNHEKARLAVAKCYKRICNKRNDFLHKLSTYLVERYDTICLEDLNVKDMLHDSTLARHIQDASWSEFMRMLQYKCDWYGKNILFIGRYEPSSKTCHNCGHVNKDLQLSDREWDCPICGTRLDRDINAAINIKEMALRDTPVGKRGSGCGGDSEEAASYAVKPDNGSNCI